MPAKFDRRVVPERVIAFVRACQHRVSCHLGGGAALSGVFLKHRLSRDVDLVCHDAAHVRALHAALPEIAREHGASLRVVQDAGSFVRSELSFPDATVEVDVLFEATRDLEPAAAVEEVEVESLADLRAAKLTCLLSRSEPRDLVDLMFLDRAGYPPEQDLANALKKDAGIDPRVLGWLLGQFPLEPLPQMLSPMTKNELLAFRDALRDRLRKASLP